MILQQKAKGVIQIFRPELPLAAGMCVLIGEVLALGAFPPFRAGVLGFAIGFFLSGSALIFNDYFDLEVDRINQPQRPLPAGLLSPADVLILGVLTALVGLVAAWTFSPLISFLGLLTWLMGFLYNWKLKAAGLWGNLIVCASVAMTFLLGGIVVGQLWNRFVWVFALIAFFFDLAEEIAGDAMDAEGDQKRGSKSIAIVSGKQTALSISASLFGLVVLLSLLPIAWGERGLAYILPIAFMDILIVYFVRRLVKSQTPVEGRKSMRGLYLSASLGLLAFLLASITAL